MISVNIHEAKTQLSKLIDMAAKGDGFVIAKSGKPMVKVISLDAPKAAKRTGFLSGQVKVPDDFDTMGKGEIEAMFGL